MDKKGLYWRGKTRLLCLYLPALQAAEGGNKMTRKIIYRRLAIACCLLAAIGIYLLLFACAPTTRILWNEYNAAYLAETEPTDKSLDVLVVVRVRGFRNREAMLQAAYDRGWSPSPNLGGLCISGPLPEANSTSPGRVVDATGSCPFIVTAIP